LLLHAASQSEIIAGVERRLPRDGPYPLSDYVRLDGFVISFIHQDCEGIGQLRSFQHNRLMLGQGRLAPDPAIIKIVARWFVSCWFRIHRDRKQSGPIVTARYWLLLYQTGQRRRRLDAFL
jgi:hypothetical protein